MFFELQNIITKSCLHLFEKRKNVKFHFIVCNELGLCLTPSSSEGHIIRFGVLKNAAAFFGGNTVYIIQMQEPK